jgi:hypothetical protein
LWHKWYWFYRNDQYSAEFIKHEDVYSHRHCKEADKFTTLEAAQDKLEHIKKPLKPKLIVVYPTKQVITEPVSKRKIKV